MIKAELKCNVEELNAKIEHSIEYIGGTQNHRGLINLEYESSGHTGFVSNIELQAVEEKLMLIELGKADKSELPPKKAVNNYTLFASEWSNEKTQTIEIMNKSESLQAIVSASQSGDGFDVLENLKALSKANLYKIVDNGSSLTFYCETIPIKDLKILVSIGG